jgi:hypothetical protein
VQHPEPQQLGLGDGEVTGKGKQPEPGGQVGGDRHEWQPGGVDGVLAGREAAEPGVFGGFDAVFDPGVGAVPGLQERQLPGGVLVAKAW